MKAGNLWHTVTFQQAVETIRPDGSFDTAWQDITTNPTVPAGVIYNSGTKNVVGDRQEAGASYSCIIRWRGDINIKMRVVWNDKAHRIIAITSNDLRRQMLTITMIEKNV